MFNLATTDNQRGNKITIKIFGKLIRNENERKMSTNCRESLVINHLPDIFCVGVNSNLSICLLVSPFSRCIWLPFLLPPEDK